MGGVGLIAVAGERKGVGRGVRGRCWLRWEARWARGMGKRRQEGVGAYETYSGVVGGGTFMGIGVDSEIKRWVLTHPAFLWESHASAPRHGSV